MKNCMPYYLQARTDKAIQDRPVIAFNTVTDNWLVQSLASSGTGKGVCCTRHKGQVPWQGTGQWYQHQNDDWWEVLIEAREHRPVPTPGSVLAAACLRENASMPSAPELE